MDYQGIVDGGIVVHPIGNEPLKRTVHTLQELRNNGGILGMPIAEGARVDPAGLINTDVEFFPLPTIFLAMLLAVPLTLSANLQPRAVDDEGDGSGGTTSNGSIDLECLVASAERGVIRNGEVQTRKTEDGGKESFGLPQGEMEKQPRGRMMRAIIRDPVGLRVDAACFARLLAQWQASSY